MSNFLFQLVKSIENMPPYLNPKPRRRHTEKLCIKFLFLIMLWVLQPQFVFALTDAEEYEIKAVYLFNLGHFIRWKDNIVAEDFEICVFGENPFGINLEYIIDKEKKIQNRNVALRQLSQINEIDNCHILFMSHTAQPQFETIFAAIRNKPILTVLVKCVINFNSYLNQNLLNSRIFRITASILFWKFSNFVNSDSDHLSSQPLR